MDICYRGAEFCYLVVMAEGITFDFYSFAVYTVFMDEEGKFFDIVAAYFPPR